MKSNNVIKAAVRASRTIATNGIRTAKREVTKKIKDDTKATFKAGSEGFKEGLRFGYLNKDNPQSSVNDVVNEAIDLHVKNAKTGENILNNGELTQDLPKPIKEAAGHALSASAMLIQRNHHKIAENVGKSQGIIAGRSMAKAVEEGTAKANELKDSSQKLIKDTAVKTGESLVEFMKKTHDNANTAYNSLPSTPYIKKTFGKGR